MGGKRLVDPERPHLYVTAILVNEVADPPRQCEMRLMIDTGSGMELVIPKQKLQLVQFYKTTAEGNGGCVYKVVLVKLPSTATDGDQETFKEAELTVFSPDETVDGEEEEEDLSNLAGFRQACVEGGALQLSPPRSPPRGNMPMAILGGAGLAKLRLEMDTIHNRQHHSTTPYLIV